MSPPIVIQNWNFAGARAVATSGSDTKANEVHVWEGKSLRQLTHQNDALFAELELGATEEVGFKSKDGTQVNGLLTYPVGYVKGTKVPLLLRIHGGPNSQDQHSLSLERQFFAANGYAVLAVNYRGSAGRGQKFSRSIFADWGNYEVQDLLAGVDHVIKMGVADADRLGVMGWSYGGFMTLNLMLNAPDVFRCGAAGAPVTSWLNYDTIYTERYMGLPKDNEDDYDAAAAMTYAEALRGRLMLYYDTADNNVHPNNTMELVSKLQRAGKSFELQVGPDRGHSGISSERMMEFFIENLVMR
jgi:dipeptidyl-peptidase-4